MNTTASSATGPGLLALWRRLSPLPGGTWLFGVLLSRIVPYTGTIHPVIVELRPGHAQVRIGDRRRVRNHLGSIHALALANLGELTTGLALTTGLPADRRSILTGLSVEYVKKARGTLTAACITAVPEVSDRAEHHCDADVFDAAGDVVARISTRWLVGRRDPH